MRHHASLTDPNDVGALLRAIDGFTGAFTTRCALKLAGLLFVRPGELRHAEWAEFDFDKAEWPIPAGKMKMKEQNLPEVGAECPNRARSDLCAGSHRNRHSYRDP